MEKINYLIPFIFFLVISFALSLIILAQIFGGDVQEAVCQEKNKDCIQNKAMVDAQLYGWAVNEFNEEELFFEYWLYNYGNIEAKDVKVKCKLLSHPDEGYIEEFSEVHSFGNIASRSVVWGELSGVRPSTVNFNEEYIGYCYVESCNNCEILYKRIPDAIIMNEA
ncbi:MAG: hypothetical protein KJ858_03385 [Nanoarchaeota archaeon]|nr:hypothetical protein [Nanoarchaeota archaeon]